jgi:hypothetical protein
MHPGVLAARLMTAGSLSRAPALRCQDRRLERYLPGERCRVQTPEQRRWPPRPSDPLSHAEVATLANAGSALAFSLPRLFRRWDRPASLCVELPSALFPADSNDHAKIVYCDA